MRKYLSVTIVFIAILVAMFISGCGDNSQAMVGNNKLTVYTSIYPLYDFTQKIGGDRITVINVIPLGSHSHSLEPSTRMVANLSQAKLFIYNGAGMEHYLPKLAPSLEAAGVKLVDTSQGVALLKNEDYGNHAEDEHLEEHESHGVYDPHIWLSPARASTQAVAIYQALAEVDPVNADYYEDNLLNLQKEFSLLDQEYKIALAACPRKDLVVSHSAFQYLATDYDLQQIPLLGVNADAEPGPATLKNIINYIEMNKIKYIFWDPLDSPKLAETLNKDTGTEALPLYSLGTLSEKEIKEGLDYFSAMRTNLVNLQKGLGDLP